MQLFASRFWTYCISYRFRDITFKARKWLVFVHLLCLTPRLGNLLEFLDEIYPVKIRGMGLPNSEKFQDPNFNCFLLIHPCDRRTDVRTGDSI